MPLTLAPQADGKARTLLESFLDDKQRSQLARWNGFAQTGSDRRCYVVLCDDRDTIYDPADGRGRGYYCQLGTGLCGPRLPAGDLALAMKLAVETDAPDLQRQACTMSNRPGSTDCDCSECRDDGPWARVDRIWADHCGGAENTHEDKVDYPSYFREFGTAEEARQYEEADRERLRAEQLAAELRADRQRRLEEAQERLRASAREWVDLGATREGARAMIAPAEPYHMSFDAVPVRAPEQDLTPDGYTRQQLTDEDWSHPYRGPDFDRRWYGRVATTPVPGLRVIGEPWRVEFNGNLQATLDPAWITDVSSSPGRQAEQYQLMYGEIRSTVVAAPERTITLTFRVTDYQLQRLYGPRQR